MMTTTDPRTQMARDLERVARLGRWDRALMLIGATNLGVFLLLHWLYLIADETAWKHLVLWNLNVLAALLILRAVAGRGWLRATPMAMLVARVWGSVLILGFHAVALNWVMGTRPTWYRFAWGMIDTFGFMMMTFLLSAWFFLAAVAMFAADMLMTRYPDHQFLILGIALCACLQATAICLRWRWGRAGHESPQSLAGARP